MWGPIFSVKSGLVPGFYGVGGVRIFHGHLQSHRKNSNRLVLWPKNESQKKKFSIYKKTVNRKKNSQMVPFGS